MAKLEAFHTFNIDWIDLNYFERHFYDGVVYFDEYFRGYPDLYEIIAYDAEYDSVDAFSLWGKNFGHDADTNQTLGTVQAMSHWWWIDDQWLELFHISGLNASLDRTIAAMESVSDHDDIALLRSEFSRNDRILLSYGDDKMRGFGGNDLLRGDSGNDTLYGDGGADTLRGDKGNDRLFGNAGKDVVIGGKGKDFLVGGGGSDVFVFATGDGKDRIKDFSAKGKNQDVLDLSGLESVKNWADLRDNHLTQKNGNVVIDGLGGDKITLLGVKIGDLDAGDFLF